jgi:dipeptidyl aminopeptidase/acylaminoacyl peptidase
MRGFFIAVLALAAAACGPAPAPKAPAGPPPQPELIPRAALFGLSEAKDARLSPDGTQIAYLLLKEGAYTLVVAQVSDPLDTKELATAVTEPPAWGGASVIYRTGKGYRAVDPKLDDSDVLLTSAAGAQFVTANASDAVFRFGGNFAALDLHRDVQVVLLHARDGFADALFGARGRPVAALKPNGELWSLAGRARKLTAFAPGDAELKRVSPDEKSVFVIAAPGRDRKALIKVDLASGAAQIVAQNAGVDVTDLLLDKTGAVAAVESEGLIRQWTPITAAAKAEFALLRQTARAHFTIVSRSADDARWIVREEGPTQTARVWLYDRAKKTLDRLFIEHPPMDGRPLVSPRVVQIPGRGKYTLPAYVTMNGAGAKPLVLIAHVAREHADYDPLAQMFADRGYAVLALQTRGKAGFGKAFAALGQENALRAMNEDIADAARWAVTQRLASPGKIAVIGEGIGGVTAIASLAFPKAYACAVAVDPVLAQAAPDRIATPLLLVRRSARSSSAPGEALVAALKAAKKPVAYAIYRDGGERFGTLAEEMSFGALTSAFFSKCLGGRADPIGPGFRGSSLQIAEGGALIPTLADALAPRDADLGAPP